MSLLDHPDAQGIHCELAETEGDIVNCESVPGKTGSLSVSPYSSHSMMAIHYVLASGKLWEGGRDLNSETFR